MAKLLLSLILIILLSGCGAKKSSYYSQYVREVKGFYKEGKISKVQYKKMRRRAKAKQRLDKSRGQKK